MDDRRAAAEAVLALFRSWAAGETIRGDWQAWSEQLAAAVESLLVVADDQATTLEAARDALLDEPQPTAGNGQVNHINPLPGSHVRVDGVAEIVPEDVATLLDALEVAADYKRDRAETCPDCDGAPAGSPDICGTCESRLHLAGLYDQLADRLGGGS